ncbi:MAG TPA: hypothetical protein VM241_07380 [Candidatus Thermoplasmatota archaeon]|nr:hypothetical protein [Candidatus Thermoplasmatota archaeon]
MRAAAFLLGTLLLAGCMGSGTTSQAPLPEDFTITQPAAASVAASASYSLHIAGPTVLNATLVWGTPSNAFTLELKPAASEARADGASGTRVHWDWTLQPGDYTLAVKGTPLTPDTWHLEAHFTRA